MAECNNKTDMDPNSCVNDLENSNEEKNDVQDNLFTTINWFKANLDQLIDNCCSINDQINSLEMDCIDLLQPMDIITLNKELKRLGETEEIYMKALRELENQN